MIRSLVLLLLIFLPSTLVAQPPPIPYQYRLTRSAPSQPTVTAVFLYSSGVCGLSRIVLSLPGTMRIADPANETLDCEFLSLGNDPILRLQPNVTYSFTLAAALNTMPPVWSSESNPPTTLTLLPPPSTLRLIPSTSFLQVDGTIYQHIPNYPLAGSADTIEVASLVLDGDTLANPVHLGAWTFPLTWGRPSQRVRIYIY